ncbi:MAG TPA: hypothetical protein VEZ70_02080 [Allosphingosinicella sp.]|nr:hypothetical protein [Allosphingosinicella sp.]
MIEFVDVVFAVDPVPAIFASPPIRLSSTPRTSLRSWGFGRAAVALENAGRGATVSPYCLGRSSRGP